MFKVNDPVVAKSGDNRIFYFRNQLDEKRIFLTLNDQHYAYPFSWFRHATPKEIAAGHRIDGDLTNEGSKLETLRECDISPNCTKIDLEQVK